MKAGDKMKFCKKIFHPFFCVQFIVEHWILLEDQIQSFYLYFFNHSINLNLVRSVQENIEVHNNNLNVSY